MTDTEFWESQRGALRLLGDTIRRRGLKLIKTLHEKTDVPGHSLHLCRYEAEDGSYVYGVEVDGKLVFVGTKAEAKARYGNWRKP